MLHGLSHGWTLGECLRFAAAAGALSVGYLGASNRIPTLDEIAAHVASNPGIAADYALPALERAR
ncbi:hypothetical protein EON82_21135 [bacterium]|nr:MAG: hypothetical protein EON82_21135 [bacterium]